MLQLLKPMYLEPCSTREATAMINPCSATREQPPLATTKEKPTQQRRPSTVKNKRVCVCVCVCVRAHAQSCLTLCDPMDYSLPDSSVHGIFQARMWEWVAIFYSGRACRPRDQTCVVSLVSPALAGRFFTTLSPGKPLSLSLSLIYICVCVYIYMYVFHIHIYIYIHTHI